MAAHPRPFDPHHAVYDGKQLKRNDERRKERRKHAQCCRFPITLVESGEVSDPTSLAADASHLTICKRTGYLLINRHSEDAKPPQRFGPSVVSGCSFRGRIYIVDRDSVVLGPSRPTSDTPPRNAICSDPIRAPIFSYSVHARVFSAFCLVLRQASACRCRGGMCYAGKVWCARL